MTFSPLGAFDQNMVIPQHLIDAARDYFNRLPSEPAGSILREYLHWTVGHYEQDFPDYNGSVAYDAATGFFRLDIPHDPSDNAIGVNNNTPAYHTYMRNTGAFGIATDDMVFATTTDFGPEPLTISALWWLCAGVAAVAAKYGIDINGLSTDSPYDGEPNVLTHAEAASRPGNPAQYAPYGPSETMERWDLASFVPVPPGFSVTDETATLCGNALRALAHRIKLAAFP